MKYLLSFLLIVVAVGAGAQVKQKVLTECTVFFTVSYTDTLASKETGPALVVLYVKGQQSRVDFTSPSYSQVRIHDARKDSIYLLQHVGKTKLKRSYDSTGWEKVNNKYDSLSIRYVDETKKILGHDCKKAIITLKNGATYILFYATGILPSTREYEIPFRTVPGLVLEYETTADGSNRKIRYTATKINPTPVQASKFEVPRSGYRVL